MHDIHNVKERLKKIKTMKSLTCAADLLPLLKKVNKVLENENKNYRPYDSSGLPGGAIYLYPNKRTILVPDLHARFNFIYTLMTINKSLFLSQLISHKLQIVCLGDGLHSEGHIQRWLNAYNEYTHGYIEHKHIDEEMLSGLKTMEMVMYLKSSFPDSFHYLKGNHDNIANETGNGNFSFYKYADEGAMVTDYMLKYFGRECFHEYYKFEKNLPLLAVGRNFMTSHAEPARFFDKKSVIEYRRRSDVIQGLTWTGNDKAQYNSVMDMITHYIDPQFQKKTVYFGGHRPVSGTYNIRAEGRYIQIHNPRKYTIAIINPGEEIDPQRAVKSLST